MICLLTLASTSSCSVFTPNLGMLELVRLELCINFFTPLIWDIGLFFFSFSFWVGEGISTSCCLSEDIQKTSYLCYHSTHSQTCSIFLKMLLNESYKVHRMRIFDSLEKPRGRWKELPLAVSFCECLQWPGPSWSWVGFQQEWQAPN